MLKINQFLEKIKTLNITPETFIVFENMLFLHYDIFNPLMTMLLNKQILIEDLIQKTEDRTEMIRISQLIKNENEKIQNNNNITPENIASYISFNLNQDVKNFNSKIYSIKSSDITNKENIYDHDINFMVSADINDIPGIFTLEEKKQIQFLSLLD